METIIDGPGRQEPESSYVDIGVRREARGRDGWLVLPHVAPPDVVKM